MLGGAFGEGATLFFVTASSIVRTQSGTGSGLGGRGRFVAAIACAAGLFAVAPGAQAHGLANPSLRVNFFSNGTIAVTLPDGTAVGTPSGAPTVIPAGYYTVNMIGPGGCSNVPYFELKGHGTSIVDNMDEGELSVNSYNAYLPPNSTFTWKDDDANPMVIYTFQTSSDVQGTPPATSGSGGLQGGKHGTATSSDPLGSDTPQLRGTLNASVTATGVLALAFKGNAVTSLEAGKYTIVVNDKSKSSGFSLLRGKPKRTFNLTGNAYVGTHKSSLMLAAGQWSFASGAGKTSSAFVVTNAGANT